MFWTVVVTVRTNVKVKMSYYAAFSVSVNVCDRSAHRLTLF